MITHNTVIKPHNGPQTRFEGSFMPFWFRVANVNQPFKAEAPVRVTARDNIFEDGRFLGYSGETGCDGICSKVLGLRRFRQEHQHSERTSTGEHQRLQRLLLDLGGVALGARRIGVQSRGVQRSSFNRYDRMPSYDQKAGADILGQSWVTTGYAVSHHGFEPAGHSRGLRHARQHDE